MEETRDKFLFSTLCMASTVYALLLWVGEGNKENLRVYTRNSHTTWRLWWAWLNDCNITVERDMLLKKRRRRKKTLMRGEMKALDYQAGHLHSVVDMWDKAFGLWIKEKNDTELILSREWAANHTRCSPTGHSNTEPRTGSGLSHSRLPRSFLDAGRTTHTFFFLTILYSKRRSRKKHCS